MTQYRTKNILVAVDLSEASLNALETAAALAKKNGATLTILNVEDDSFEFLDQDHGVHHSPDVVAALANGIQHKTEIVPEILNRKGHVASVIVKTALEGGADLIVMGTHGASGLRDCFIGTHTYHVIKYAQCPVLTVPAHRKWSQFRKVLFPIRPVSGALSRYEVAKQFFSGGTQLNILGLSYRMHEKGTSLLEDITLEISSKIKEDRIATKAAWGDGNGTADDVLNYASQSNSDLIVITPSLDISNKPYFIGPHAQKIISNAKVPTLNIRKIAIPAMV